MRFTRLVSLSLVAAALLVSDATAQGSERVYDFDDLSQNCALFATTPGLYQDLVFSSVYFAVCTAPVRGSMSLVPSQFGVGGRVPVRVQLPELASSVSVQSYLADLGDAPQLAAFDANGVELGRVEDDAMNTWVTLAVQTSDAQIAEIELSLPQLVVYLDDLTVTYGSVEPEPEPDPDPQPLPQPSTDDPSSVLDCMSGGWQAFGFENQGQCVRFVRTGVDSRQPAPQAQSGRGR